LVEADEKKILVDAGSGATIQLLKLGIKVWDLDYIFITHLHADHTLDLIQLIMNYFIPVTFWGIKKTKMVKIMGPKGIRKFVDNLLTIYNHSKAIDFEGFQIEEITTETIFDSFTVIPSKVTHLDISANSYSFKANNKKVVLTGDAADCEGIRDIAKNADLFICDASHSKEELPGNVHLNTLQIGEIAKNGKVKKVVLSHLLPPAFNKDLVLEVKENFNGDVVLAKDLMTFEV
jgi:ribonuclease Z